MREIKFRAKRKDNGNWEYGNLIEHFDILDRRKKYYYIESFTGEDRDEVLHETIGQFTGLKDKNGKEIYEGDLLKTYYGLQFVVKYLAPNFMAVRQDDYSQFIDDMTELQIIGNIHEVQK